MAIMGVTQELKALDRFLYTELVGLLVGEPLELILETNIGFEGWRRVTAEFERLTSGRKLMKLEDLMHPELGGPDI